MAKNILFSILWKLGGKRADKERVFFKDIIFIPCSQEAVKRLT